MTLTVRVNEPLGRLIDAMLNLNVDANVTCEQTITFALLEVLDLVLVVGVVGVVGVEEVELGVVEFILPDPSLELRTVTSHETRGLVDDICRLSRKQ